MTALRWTGTACRVVALALVAWVVLTGWRPVLAIVDRLEVRVLLRPADMPIVAGPRRT